MIATSTEALNQNGAALYRLSAKEELSEVMRWSGQGFLRAHSYNGRVAVPDADAPFGLGFFVRFDVDGFVFFVDPSEPKKIAKGVIPSVYHVFDTALLDGHLYASSGAYVPRDMPYRSSRAPAALFVEEEQGKPWRRVIEHPETTQEVSTGVIRFTYLLPLSEGGLLAGVSDWNAGSYAVRIEGLPDSPRLARIEGIEGQTLRWARFQERVYHIAQANFGTLLTVSVDGGRHFQAMSAQKSILNPQDLVAIGDTLFLLASGKLYQSQDGESFSLVSLENPSLFHQDSSLVSAPLEVHEGRLFAASPTSGEIFEAVPQ